MQTTPFTIEKMDGATVVILRGEMDFLVARDLEAILDDMIAGGEKNVIVDMQDVTFACSTMVGTMVSAAGRFRGRGGELKICCVPATATSVMQTLGVEKFIALFDDRTGALLASPEEVREKLGIRERRVARDRRVEPRAGRGRRRTDETHRDAEA
jgi:anti-sigma B factor antagonist